MIIGRKIYYEKTTGLVLWDKGEYAGSVHETTIEEDLEAMPTLQLIPIENLGVKQLQSGESESQFNACKAYKINPITEELEFLF